MKNAVCISVKIVCDVVLEKNYECENKIESVCLSGQLKNFVMDLKLLFSQVPHCDTIKTLKRHLSSQFNNRVGFAVSQTNGVKYCFVCP